MKSWFRFLFVFGLIGALFVHPLPVRAGGIVGIGTPGSCSEVAFFGALSGGGTVTFNCGSAPYTLVLNNTIDISPGPTTIIDGGNRITLQRASGRIFNVQAGASLTLRNISLDGGLTNDFSGGAALYNAGGTILDRVTIRNAKDTSGFTGPALEGGGAITNAANGVLTIYGSVLENNESQSRFGGAILNYGDLTISNSVLRNNKADRGGGALANSTIKPVVIEQSTLYSNEATYSFGGVGGAIYHVQFSLAGQPMRIWNSTIYENRAASSGGGIFVDGSFSRMEIIHTTISKNEADFDLKDSTGYGGGISNQSSQVKIQNTILAENYASITLLNNVRVSVTSECYGTIDTSLAGKNLMNDYDTATCSITNLSRIILEPLNAASFGDHGGLTPTLSLKPNSAAINNTICLGSGFDQDQRGVKRPQGGGCDMGAFELPFLFLPLIIR